MLLFALLIACNNETDVSGGSDTQNDTDPQAGTGPTRPIQQVVDSAAVDTGLSPHPEDTAVSSTTATGGDTGPKVVDTGVYDIEGRTYRLNPANMTLTLSGLGITLNETAYLVQVLDVDGINGTAELRVGAFLIGSNVQQNLCSATVDFEAEWSDPLISFGPEAGTIGLWGKPTPVEQVEGTIEFDSLHESVEDASLTGLYDINNFSSYYYGSGNYVCSIFAYYGASCTSCPTSGSPNCVGVNASGAKGGWIEGLELEERTQTDIQADPSCP